MTRRSGGRNRAGWLFAAIATLLLAAPAPASHRGGVPRALVGTFTTTIGTDAYPTLLPGHYTMHIASDGTLKRAGPASPAQTLGKVSVSGSRIVFPATPHCLTKGSYRWAIHRGTLALTKIADSCRERVLNIANRAWVKAR